MARTKSVANEVADVADATEVVANEVADDTKYLTFAEVQAILRQKQNENTN